MMHGAGLRMLDFKLWSSLLPFGVGQWCLVTDGARIRTCSLISFCFGEKRLKNVGRVEIGQAKVKLAGTPPSPFEYVDPPATDPPLFGFIKSHRYLPKRDSISRVELYSPGHKVLAEDRRGYATILWLSAVALIAAVGTVRNEPY
jgi:hypothetical protein